MQAIYFLDTPAYISQSETFTTLGVSSLAVWSAWSINLHFDTFIRLFVVANNTYQIFVLPECTDLKSMLGETKSSLVYCLKYCVCNNKGI